MAAAAAAADSGPPAGVGADGVPGVVSGGLGDAAGPGTVGVVPGAGVTAGAGGGAGAGAGGGAVVVAGGGGAVQAVSSSSAAAVG